MLREMAPEPAHNSTTRRCDLSRLDRKRSECSTSNSLSGRGMNTPSPTSSSSYLK